MTLILKFYCRQRKTLAKQRERLQFLLSCKDYGIFPKHISNTIAKTQSIFTSQSTRSTMDKINTEYLLKILKLEIKQTHINIKETTNNIFHADILMKATLNENEYKTFVNKQNHTYKHIAEQTKAIHVKKLIKTKRNSNSNNRNNL